MKDFDKPYRKAIYDSLSGNISSYKVFDEVRKIGEADQQFVLFGGQRSVKDADASTDCAWARRCSIEIIAVDKRGISVSKDLIDDISEIVLSQLFQTVGQLNVTVPSGFLFLNPDVETGVTSPLQLNTSETVMAKVITVSTTIIQQS